MSVIIDISHHQSPTRIDYDKLAKEVALVIIRTQYGSKLIDRHYKTHHAEFKKRGVPTAAYAWVRGTSISDMEVEAVDFYNRTKDLNPTFWFLDVEEKSMADMRAGVSAYVKKLRSLGAEKVGIYIAHHLYKSFNLDLSEADAVWIPHYGVNNGTLNSKPAFACDIHQYTSVGRLNGYNSNLDLNRLLGTKPLDFFTGQVKKEPVQTHPKNNDAYMHVVVAGDTLSKIAVKYGVTVDYLVKLNNILDRDLIYPGQRIKLKGSTPASKPAASTAKYHIVVKGDTVWDLARKYGSTVAQIKSWNNLKNEDLIFPSQKLRVK